MGRRESVLGEIRAVYEGGAVAGMSDAQLVERFVSGGERAVAAFSALVERHGPMVRRVCRAALRDDHDADDAFQAVFLVLVRKAGTVQVRDTLGPWLHAVALRTSACARTRAQRRRTQESRRAAEAEAEAASDTVGVVDADLVTLIHEEVGRLPDRFRAAVVLCDLEGFSHEEAARRLGCPVGTVKSRQARGRERLRGRLERRRLAPTPGAFATALPPLPVAEEVVRATARAAEILRAGPTATAGVVSAATVSLAQAVLRTMMMNRLKWGLLSLLTAGVIATGTASLTLGMFAAEASPDDRPRGGPPAPVPPKGPRPSAGSLFQLHFAADLAHDAGAVEQPGARWVRVDPRSNESLDGLVTRGDPRNGQMVLVKLDPRDLTERDLLDVKEGRDGTGRRAITFYLTRDASRRFGALTRAHLPTDGGTSRYRLAIIVEGVVVSLPSINAEVRDVGIIEFPGDPRPGEIDRVVARLAEAAAYNAPPPKAKAVPDQAAAIHEATAVDLPALEEANRLTIEAKPFGSSITLANPGLVKPFLRVLRPSHTPPGGGEVAAMLSFYHDDELIRKLWVHQGGEWGVERPVTSWTTGSDPALWRLVRHRMFK